MSRVTLSREDLSTLCSAIKYRQEQTEYWEAHCDDADGRNRLVAEVKLHNRLARAAGFAELTIPEFYTDPLE